MHRRRRRLLPRRNAPAAWAWAAVLVGQALLPLPQSVVAPGTFAVDARAGCATSQSRATALRTGVPWCSFEAARRTVARGDVVHVRPGIYRQKLDVGPGAAGTTWLADPGVVIQALGLDHGIKVSGAPGVTLSGFTVRGARDEDVWVSGSDDVHLVGMVLTGSANSGLIVGASRRLRVSGGEVSGNVNAGVREGRDVSGSIYDGVRVTGNGHNGTPRNGDGLQLDGTGTTLRGLTVTGNGDDSTMEHGVYFGRDANGWLVTDSVLTGNSGAGIKAQGSGRVERSTIGGGPLGVYADLQPVGSPAVLTDVTFDGTLVLRIRTGTSGRVRVQRSVDGRVVVVTSVGTWSTW